MNKKIDGNGNFVKRPDFIEIKNVYDVLDKLVDQYGIEKIILHLGQVANKKISRNFASKIWGLSSVTFQKSDDID